MFAVSLSYFIPMHNLLWSTLCCISVSCIALAYSKSNGKTMFSPAYLSMTVTIKISFFLISPKTFLTKAITLCKISTIHLIVKVRLRSFYFRHAATIRHVIMHSLVIGVIPKFTFAIDPGVEEQHKIKEVFYSGNLDMGDMTVNESTSCAGKMHFICEFQLLWQN